MPKLLSHQISRIGLILLLAFASLLVINYISLPWAPCVDPQIIGVGDNTGKNQNKENACPEIRGIISAGLYQIRGWTPEAWTAAFTILLALSTLMLAIATSRLVQLARQEFIASHRPRLRIRIVQLTYNAIEQPLRGVLVIVNVGESIATITDLCGDIACRYGPCFHQPGLNIARPQIIAKPILGVGEHGEFPIVSNAPISHDDFRNFHSGKNDMCVVGRVAYTDANNISRITGYFRVYDRERRHFVRAGEPDYEYED